MTTTASYDHPDVSFNMQQHVETIYGYGPNKRWIHTDRAGHAHCYDDRYEPLTGTAYPTLVRRSEHVPCTDDECGCDGYEDDWLECARCGERIRPSSVPMTYHRPCGVTCTIDDVQVTQEEFNRRLDAFLATREQVLDA